MVVVERSFRLLSDKCNDLLDMYINIVIITIVLSLGINTLYPHQFIV